MHSYSEIECAFILEKFSIDDYLKLCEVLRTSNFSLDIESPGYILGDDFVYPDWKTFEQAYNEISNGGYTSFCINFCSSEDEKKPSSLTVEGDVHNACIAVKVSEEFFVDPKEKKINQKLLYDFVNMVQSLVKGINVNAWKIAQSGFDYDLSHKSFVKYSIDGYPHTLIEDLINWYEQDYLARWK